MFINFRRVNLTENEIEIQLRAIGFQNDHIDLLQDFSKLHSTLPCDQLRFRELEWRLEAKVASKSCHNFKNIEPKILMKFNLSRESENSSQIRRKISTPCDASKELFIESNVSNLIHVIHKLEQALREAKSYRNQQF